MAFIIGLLTLVMVLDCVIVILLVLIQLPKKEAGAGLAFGGTASDALFGAGSGTVLTKITKYAATVFFALALFLSILQGNYHRRTTTAFTKKLEQAGPTPAPAVAPAAPPGTPGALAATNGAATNVPITPAAENTNLPTPAVPAPSGTNAPANPAPK